jgi:hypothetical protein
MKTTSYRLFLVKIRDNLTTSITQIMFTETTPNVIPKQAETGVFGHGMN